MKSFKIGYQLFVAFIFIALVSCEEEGNDFNPYEQFATDVEIIENYIDSTQLEASEIGEYGVFFASTHIDLDNVENMVTDYDAQDNSTLYVTVGYKGYLTDGTVFDETAKGEMATFALSQLIAGWQIGIPEMTPGDSAVILVPSYYGYRNVTNGLIPANSVLIFDLYLESFERRAN